MYGSRHKSKFIKSAQTPQGRRPPVIDFQNEIIEMYVRREGQEEGVENGRGRRFIRWALGTGQKEQGGGGGGPEHFKMWWLENT